MPQDKESPSMCIRDVCRRLQVAAAELGLVHDAMQRHLPGRVKTGDVAWAVEEGSAVERQLEEAMRDLEALADLIEGNCGN